MPDVKIKTPNRTLNAYLANTQSEQKAPGVVLIHDVLGLTKETRRKADWLASSGYVTIAPDMFSGGLAIPCLINTFRDLLSEKGDSFENIAATVEYLRSHDRCSGRFGIMGFCMGGGFALLTAKGYGFSASSVNYGMLPKDLESIVKGACPVVASFGADDKTLPNAAAKLDAALAKNNVVHDVKEYPHCSHAFMDKYDGAVGWLVERIGMGPNAEATRDAENRILEFFGKHLLIVQ
jgi:carboxymethylenebutenolidase